MRVSNEDSQKKMFFLMRQWLTAHGITWDVLMFMAVIFVFNLHLISGQLNAKLIFLNEALMQ